MKRWQIITLLCALGMLLVLALSTQAARPVLAENEGPGLMLTDVKVAPEKPSAGDELAMQVTILNQGTLALTDTATVTLAAHIYVAAAGQIEVGAPCLESAPEAVALNAGSQVIHDFACRPRIASQGSYSVVVSLSAQDAAGQPVGSPVSAATLAMTVLPYTTALPDQLARLFAGLGIFAALMMILALGTEVVIDSLKLMIGLKSKVSAFDALNDMQKYLPGQLAALGAGVDAQGQVQHLVEDLRTNLKPLQDLASAKAALDTGDFGKAFKEMQAIIDKQTAPLTQTVLDELKSAALRDIDRLREFTRNFNLPPAFIDQQIADLKARIAQFQLGDAAQAVQIMLNGLHAFIPQAIHEWLKQVADKSRDEILNLFDTKLSVELQGLGIPKGAIDPLRARLSAILDVIDTKALHTTDTYLAAMDNLLQAIEDRRNDMQSPFRKFWRYLSRSGRAQWVIGTAFALIVLILVQISWGSGDAIDRAAHSDNLSPIWAGLIAGALAGGGIASLLYWLVTLGAWINKRGGGNSILRRLNGVGRFIYAWWGGIWAVLALIVFLLVQFSWGSENIIDQAVHWVRLVPILAGLIAGAWVGVVIAVLLTMLGFLGALIYKRRGGTTKWRSVNYVEILFNRLKGQIDLKGLEPGNFGATRDYKEIYRIGSLSADNIAQVVLKMTDKHRDEEDSRLRVLRVVSVIMGFVLAYLLQIDAARLLDTAVPQLSGMINFFHLDGSSLHHLWTLFPANLQLTPGIILAGLAASAGSTFWHDQLDRLQATKKASESAAELLKQAQNVVSGGR